MSDLARFIEGIPKAELHLQRALSNPSLKFALAARNGVTLPYRTEEEAKVAYDFDSLNSFLASYYEGMAVLLEEGDYCDLAMAYFRRAAGENLVLAKIPGEELEQHLRGPYWT